MPERGIDRVLDLLRSRLNHDRLPLALVLLNGGTFPGAEVYDMENRTDLSPWLAELFVNPDSRRRGTLLVRGCEEEARRLGIDALYLFTPDAAEFYLRLGRTVYELTEYKSARVTVMKRVL